LAAYLIRFAGIILFASAAGWLAGRRLPAGGGKLSLTAAGLLTGLGLLWLATAWLARPYADTDRPGAELAGWFAHSGKWLVLLAAVAFGHALTGSLKQIPPAGLRRIIYFIAVSGLTALMFFRTIPIYFLLGDGQRDADGYMRESADYEYTCGAVALLNYLEKYRGANGLTERDVSKACGITAEGSTTSALVRAARSYGITNATARVLGWPELEKIKLPAIVSVSTLPQVHHATLLIKLDAERAYFIDPAYGRHDISRERFKEIWYGKTILLE
jgi:uncharacterized membrane protein YhaH (DUF805 family)